jgi:hypothetical protein
MKKIVPPMMNRAFLIKRDLNSGLASSSAHLTFDISPLFSLMGREDRNL